MTVPTLDEMNNAIEGLLELFEEEDSESLADLIKASFGGDRSEAGRYAANVRWQRYRGESKGETKGSLPEILQPTWDEKVAKATGRPWAPLLEENFPPELREAIDRQRSAYGAYYEADRRLWNAEDEGMSVAEKEASREKLGIEFNNLSQYQQEIIELLLDEYVKSLKLEPRASKQVSEALAFRLKAQIQLNARLMMMKFDAESGLRTSKPIEEYVDGKNLRVVINTPPDVISKILSDERVKSQFETRTSKGTYNWSLRSTSETRMFSLHPDMDNQNRPIYGHVMKNGVDESISRTASHYGRAVIVLKKDVAERTTFTVGDSLISGHLPSRITEPKVSSFGTYDDTVAYTEAQIHGQVKVSDIAYIVMPPDSVTPALKSKAQKLGIPIVAQNVIGRFEKFKIEETGDMTKTTGRLIAVRGNELKLFYTHDEIQPLSNAVMRLGFIENELGERLNVNVDSVLRYGYWEEPTSLADVIKASFGGDRSEAGRYAANIRWQGQTVEDPSSEKGTGFISPTKMENPLLRDGLGRNMLRSDVEILRKLNKDFLAQLIGQTTDFIDDVPEEQFRSPELRAKLAKHEVVKGIVAGMQNLTQEEIRIACEMLNLPSSETLNDDARQTMLRTFAQHFVDQWAETSNDHERDSLMVQEVVKKVFNLEDAATVDAFGDESMNSFQKEALSKLKIAPPLEKALTALVKAQYANTQAYLASKGITEVAVSRGMTHPELAEDLKDYRMSHFYRMTENGEIELQGDPERNDDIIGNITEEEFDEFVPKGVLNVEVKMRPLSSFSVSRHVAEAFGESSTGKKVFLETKVPVSRIFSTPLTGVGCLSEDEFVLLGGNLTVKASESMTADEDFDYDIMFPSKKEEIKSYG